MPADPLKANSTLRLHTGDQIGPYVIIDTLGTGGMGEVYRARDARLERDVAIKRLSASAIGGDEARARVLREARAAAALTHPNIAAVYDVLETPDGLVIVMEYVPGESVAGRLARGPLPVEEAVRVGLQIADALTEAHDRGVIHRDLKPANVHLTPGGKAKILDFGIARSVSDPPRGGAGDPGSEAGRIIGTPGYMAPEQMSGGRADARTDIYGVGLLLFEMLTGRRPFEQADLLDSARAMFQGKVPRVDDVDPSLPDQLSSLVERAMALEPQDRPRNARELHGELERAARLLSNAPTLDETDRAVSRGHTAWPSTRRRLKQHRVALSIVAVLIAIGGYALWRWTQNSWFPPVSAHPATVGVLPLKNRTGSSDNDALAVGLTEGVATRLSSFKNVRVLSLDDSRLVAATEPDPAKVARSLGASFVIDGQIQRKGQTLDVDVTLVRNDGHRTPAGRFSGDVSQLFALHRRVAEGVTAALSGEGLVPAGSGRDTSPPTANQEAFAEYSQARLFLERPDVPGNLGHSVRLFQSAIAKDNRFAMAYAGLGQAYWALYQETKEPIWTTRATTAILDALKIEPDLPAVRLSLGVMYQSLGRLQEAQEELQRVLAAEPSNDDAHRLLAGIHVRRTEWDLAVQELQRAIALRPNYWRNHSDLGLANYRAGRLADAERAYQRVTELQPDSARGFHNLGTVQQSAGKLPEAIVSYEQANRIRPAASTYSNLGTVLFWQGEYSKAADAYQQAVKLAPNQPDLHANLGDALTKLGRQDDAVASYRRAIDEVKKLLAINDKDALNLALLGMYQAKVGNRVAADAAIQQAVALSPDDGDVLYNRVIVHALGGQLDQACSVLAKALAGGASQEIVRRAYELERLKGCPAYDKVTGRQ
jgi:serine/threonine protein kinase/tetratricopeptide (TPR) repeat protein